MTLESGLFTIIARSHKAILAIRRITRTLFRVALDCCRAAAATALDGATVRTLCATRALSQLGRFDGICSTTALGAVSDAGMLNATVPPKSPRAKTPAATDFNNMISTSSRQGFGTETFRRYVSAGIRLSLTLMPPQPDFFTESHETLRSFGSLENVHYHEEIGENGHPIR